MRRYDAITEDRIISGVSSRNLMETTAAIARWVRTAGSVDEALSFRWIEEKLRALGFQTELDQHEAYISIPVSTRLSLGDETFDGIAHAFSASTSAEGLTGELVFLEEGALAPHADIAGKIVLTPGMASGHRTLALERSGAVAQIYIHDDHLHETSVSPIWGNPAPETIGGYPRTPGIAVRRADGERLRAKLDQGPVRVTIQTEVDTGWRYIPLLTAALPDIPSNEYLLFSSHVDSWHHGAMDNAAANATLIEVARLMKYHRRWLRRGLKLAFWSGHSQGRFAGSAWFADRYWQELRQRCVGHVYVDSTGGRGATVVTEAPVMAETKDVAAAALAKVTGERLEGKRLGRFADQSFYGVGLPCTFGVFSEQPAAATQGEIGLRTGGTRSGGLGWWWHTVDDMIDTVDEANLVRDTQVYASLVFRLLSERILPYDYRRAVEDIQITMVKLQEAAGSTFDLQPLVAALNRLESAVGQFYRGLASEQLDDDLLRAANQSIMELAHHLVPINYHQMGLFDHDPAEPLQPVPALQPLRRLAQLDSDDDERFLLLTRLRRSFNWVLSEVESAISVAETASLLVGMEEMDMEIDADVEPAHAPGSRQEA